MSAHSQTGPDWVRVTEDAGWQARDSMGGVVHDGRLWILGGWFNSMIPNPRDVWSSADGVTWECVLKGAPWKHSDFPMSLAFKDRMWMMGGWYNGRLDDRSPGNEVWSSTDGVTWDQATSAAGWSARMAAGKTVFKDRMWILGGQQDYFFGDETDLKNDVWSSTDGETWECVTDHAAWSPRAYHEVVAFDGKLWLFGGGNYKPEHHALNDVWCSEDGAEWTQVTDAAPWPPRLWFSSAVYRDRMWVFAGWSEEHDNFGDVWFSTNGADWTQLKSDVIWKERHAKAAYVFDDKLWVAGGHARPLNSEVWSLQLPTD